MAGRKLAANVWVGGVFYASGSTPEKDVADQITNPKAWHEGDAKPQRAAEKPSEKSK